MNLLDFRSDTVTSPDEGMRQAMARAEVGDDVYGEDPTVRALEEKVAALLGKEAAVFVPSGTMANQLAIGAQVQPGDEVIAEAGSHCLNFEGGALSALWGAQPRTLDGTRGMFTPDALNALVRPVADHFPRSRLLCLENTSNRGGGSVWPLAQMQQVAAAARSHGLSIHLDGARLFNAQVAAGVPAARWAACADTVSVCLSKGLGAPVGSLSAATREAVSRMRRLRKRLGGGMRQAGVLAAAGLYALERNVDRLAEDHANARRLADGLAQVRALKVDPATVQTNLVFAEVTDGRDAVQVTTALREQGVLCNPEGSNPRLLRFVTHLHLTAAHIDEALRRIEAAL